MLYFLLGLLILGLNLATAEQRTDFMSLTVPRRIIAAITLVLIWPLDIVSIFSVRANALLNRIVINIIRRHEWVTAAFVAVVQQLRALPTAVRTGMKKTATTPGAANTTNHAPNWGPGNRAEVRRRTNGRSKADN